MYSYYIMQPSNYSICLPLSLEPSVGYRQSDVVQFKISHVGQAIRSGTIRLNGILCLYKTGGTAPLADTDLCYLNPHAGANGILQQVITNVNGVQCETISQYNKYCSVENEFSQWHDLDLAQNSNNMLELMTYGNNNLGTGADLKGKMVTGSNTDLPIIPGNTGSQLPFSIDLNICLNKASQPLAYSKTGDIMLTLTFANDKQIGLTTRTAGGLAGLSYAVKNLDIRYIQDVEENVDVSPIIMKTVAFSHTPTVTNRLSSLAFTASNAFNSVICSFIQSSHITGNNGFEYDYLANEALPRPDFVEFRLNGNQVFFPLRFYQAEIATQFLLALQNPIDMYTPLVIDKHSYNYNKLTANASNLNGVATGYGIGANFGLAGIPAGTGVQVNVNLLETPSENYACYIWTLGKLIL